MCTRAFYIFSHKDIIYYDLITFAFPFRNRIARMRTFKFSLFLLTNKYIDNIIVIISVKRNCAQTAARKQILE